ncbi:hypothetical protein EV368DRAFT_80538 [Lentinula lateritia]|nr:hypothetical protein EV368DRAFT_80538 [Lentinula lateritia]
MPNLVSLDFVVHPRLIYKAHIINLLHQLCMLQKLTIPAFQNISAILSCICNLSATSLTHISFFNTSDAPNSITHVINLAGVQGHGLANLTVLQIHSTYSAAAKIFVGEGNLKDITITSHDPASAADIRKLLSRIGQTCTRVEEVKLTFGSNSRELIDKIKENPDDVVAFEDITPILCCTKMTWFLLSTACPLSMDDNDIQKLAESWPSLVSLWLSSRPGRLALPNRRQLSFKSLIHLAYHCPCLSYASLYIDDPCIPSPENFPVFSSPFNLDVGFSPIENPAEIASFLSKVFPVNSTLWYGIDHFLSEGEDWKDPDPISLNIKGRWSERWATVESFLPQMIQMRLDTEKLKQEVARLKIKREPRWH